MALALTAFLAPQYDKSKFYWLKFFIPGTTSPKVMYADADGGTALAKAQINVDGYITSDGDAIFIPYVEGAYDAYLFPTESDADNNDTSNAIRIADNIEPASSGGGDSDSSQGIFEWVPIVDGQQTYTVTTPLLNLVGATVTLSKSGSEVDGTLLEPAVDYTIDGETQLTLTRTYPGGKLKIENQTNISLLITEVNVKDFGAVGDGETDDTGAVSSAISAVNSKVSRCVLKFPQGSYLTGQLPDLTADEVTILAESAALVSYPDSLAVDSEAMLTITGNDCEIIGLEIDGNQFNYTTSSSCQLLDFAEGTSGHRLERVRIHSSCGRGLINRSNDFKAHSCQVDDNAGLGMGCNAVEYHDYTNCSFDRNGYGFQKTRTSPADDSHDFSGFGTAFRYRCHHVTLTACTSNDNGRDGFNVNQGSYAFKFIGCQCLRDDDGGFTVAADYVEAAAGIPGNGESCYDIEYVDCESANNRGSGLALYQDHYNVTVNGGRYYNNHRLAGSATVGTSNGYGIYVAAGSRNIKIDTKAYDERQKVYINSVSVGGGTATITAPDWVSGTADYYPRVIVYSSAGEFRGYGNIVSESDGEVEIEGAVTNSVILPEIVATDYITQRVQVGGVFFDNNCVGSVKNDGFGNSVGQSSVLQGYNMYSAAFSSGQNVTVIGGQKDDTELLLNGDFEIDISDWSFNLVGGGTASHYTGEFKRSAGALELVGGTSVAQAVGGLDANAVERVAGSFVEASTYAFGSKRSDARIKLFWTIGGSTYGTTVEHPGGERWQNLVIGAFIPFSAVDIIFRLETAEGATTYYDKCSLRVIETPINNLEDDYPTRVLPV